MHCMQENMVSQDGQPNFGYKCKLYSMLDLQLPISSPDSDLTFWKCAETIWTLKSFYTEVAFSSIVKHNLWSLHVLKRGGGGKYM